VDPVSVANLALGWLGSPPVIAIDGSDESAAGQLLFQQFERLRDSVTEDRDWTFATARLQLAADKDAPAFGYTSRFLVPGHVLRVITCALASPVGSIDAFAASMIGASSADVAQVDWVKEGPYILAGSAAAGQGGLPIPAVNVKAIVKAPDPGIWSPCFEQALAARIAADLCIAITENRGLQADLWKLYQEKLRAAASNDGRQGRSQRRTSNTLALRRR